MARKLLLILLLLNLLVSPAWAGTGIDYNDANCQGAWLMDFDEDPLRDDSQNTNTATLKGTGEPNFDASGKFGGSYDFDGNDDYAFADDDASLNISGAISIVLYVNFSNLVNNDGGLISKGPDNTTDKHFAPLGVSIYNIGILDDVMYWIIGWDAGGQSYANASSSGIEDGTWHHIAGTWDGTTNADKMILYIDGNSADTSTAAQVLIRTGNFEFDIGGWITSYNYAGKMDEVAAFDDELTSTEINDIMDNGLAPAVVAAAGQVIIISKIEQFIINLINVAVAICLS